MSAIKVALQEHILSLTIDPSERFNCSVNSGDALAPLNQCYGGACFACGTAPA